MAEIPGWGQHPLCYGGALHTLGAHPIVWEGPKVDAVSRHTGGTTAMPSDIITAGRQVISTEAG